MSQSIFPLDACEIFLIAVLTTYCLAAIICFVGACLIPDLNGVPNEPTSDGIDDE